MRNGGRGNGSSSDASGRQASQAHRRLQGPHLIRQVSALPPPRLYDLLYPPAQLLHGRQLCAGKKGGQGAGQERVGEAASRLETHPVHARRSELEGRRQLKGIQWKGGQRAAPDCATPSSVAILERWVISSVSSRDCFCRQAGRQAMAVEGRPTTPGATHAAGSGSGGAPAPNRRAACSTPCTAAAQNKGRYKCSTT